MAANSHLSFETAEHLTRHGVRQNEDGTYSWKFDNYIRSWPAYDMPQVLIKQSLVANNLSHTFSRW